MKVDSEVAQSCLTLSDPMDCIAHQAPLSMGFSKQEYWSGGAIGFTIFHVSPSLGGCWLFSVAATSVIY